MAITLPDTAAKRSAPSAAPTADSSMAGGSKVRSRLFSKYVALFVAVVSVALLTNGIFEVYFYYREHKASLVRIQREQAEAAAAKIGQFIKEIESQLGWTTNLPWSVASSQQRQFDAQRLLRQVPAVTELAQIDPAGKERLRVSRLAMNVIDSGVDFASNPKFTEAVAHKVYYGPVYFRRESEPYMTLAMAGTRRDAGVSIAEVNLKLIWDVVSQIKVGAGGLAYVVDGQGRLIAHPDISLVLRNTDLSKLPQVQAVLAGRQANADDTLQSAQNTQGQEVLTASAPVATLGWTVFVELPAKEAYASLYEALQRLAVVLLGALIFATLAGTYLARRMVGPIQALRAGAARIGAGDFSQRIAVKTGDELEGLADQFNDMGGRLQESYADLENKVERRTAELSETLKQQTATADVLKVISRSTFDLDSVLTTLTQSAVSLCTATQGVIFLREGAVLHVRAHSGASAELFDFLRANPIAPGRETFTGRAFLTGEVAHLPDVLADPEFNLPDALRIGQFRAALAVPLMREGRVEGVFSLTRPEPGPFSSREIDLVRTFADQAVIAIENVRLFDEVQAKTRDLTESLQQQTATADVLKVISRSTFDLQTVLHTLVESAARLTEADNGTITREENGVFYRAESYGFSKEFSQAIRHMPVTPERASVAGRALLEGRIVHIPDVEADPEYTFVETVGLDRFRTTLGVPMLREGTAIGVLTLTRSEVRPFTDKQIELVGTFADQAAIAIENSRLFEEVQSRTRELTQSLEDLQTAQERLVQTEKLASLGQLTAGIAHEIKNPLNFVNNFSSLSVELIDELIEFLEQAPIDAKSRGEFDDITATLKNNLEKIVQHGRRADSIVKNMLLHSRQGSGEHRPADINAIVEESLNLAYHGARAENPAFNIDLQRDLDPAAGTIEGYPQEISRVLLNLISNGFYAATKRKQAAQSTFAPVLKATSKNLGDKVEIRIRDNGTGIPPEVREKIFNPFFTTKPAGEGTGLGLSMSHDIVVKQHGGTIDIATLPGEFTEFVICLPRKLVTQVVAEKRK